MVNHDPVEWAKIEADGLAGFTGVTPLYRRPNSAAPTHANPDIPWDSDRPPVLLPPLIELGRTLVSANLADDEWYATDMGFAGPEQRKWAGVRYESAGGHEVGRMVRSLFDERGWECLWFVNPPVSSHVIISSCPVTSCRFISIPADCAATSIRPRLITLSHFCATQNANGDRCGRSRVQC